MNHNVEFLIHDTYFEHIHEAAMEAEQYVFTSPRTSLFYARLTLERSVKWLYNNDDYLKRPVANGLYELIHETTFRENLPPSLFEMVDSIRRLGNMAAHSESKCSQRESHLIFKNLHKFLVWLHTCYSQKPIKGLVFRKELIPKGKKDEASLKEIQKLEKKFEEQEKRLQESEQEREALRAQIRAFKERNKAMASKVVKPGSEAETRLLLIDVILKEAGWDPDGGNVSEYEVDGMPNASGLGFCDYVLWGDDGKPLAVVEAKKMAVSPINGKHQAELYADRLENQHGQRPIIYYSNGFQTYIWDDLFYPPRIVQGFHSKEELQTLINRRLTRKNLIKEPINKEIAGRYYQEEAIRRVAETYQNKKRHALLVMATGTGKTRTAVSLVELLANANWAKRVLFLADRVELVDQAHKAFKKHLPSISSVNLLEKKEDTTSRIVLSSYQTMTKLIENRKGDQKRYGVGYFDLIILDEAHRSIYNKYKSIFEYFDSLILGLTATPKKDIDRNTYSIFELENDDPTYAYEYEQGVADKYLVPGKPIKVKTRFLRDGIKYNELSRGEQEEYDRELTDVITGEKPEKIKSSELYKWLFNKHTVDQVLKYVMEKGIKVKGGDELGKTIVFAKNHEHAKLIVDRFYALFPHIDSKFVELIDYRVSYSANLIEKFKVKDGYPQIAVSVDMLDTGIDIPEVINLVFFKPVNSKAKFWQMIGRGTRLCEDLFQLGEDKKEFYIFDFCGNLEFFEAFGEGEEAKQQESLNQQLFISRTKLIQNLQKDNYQDEKCQEYRRKLVDFLTFQIAALDKHHFQVRPHYPQILKYENKENWNLINEDDISELHRHISHLVKVDGEDDIKRFDLLMLNLQLSLMEPIRGQNSMVKKVKKMGSQLEGKTSIPQVAEELPIIRQVQKEEFWREASVPHLEAVREALRDLVSFIDKKNRDIVYTNFQDEIVEEEEGELPVSSELKEYRERITSYIDEMKEHVTIQKIIYNKQITESDLAELEKMLFSAQNRTKEEFERVFGKEKPLGVFIRELMGLDVNAAKEAFAELQGVTTLNPDQMHFINMIIEFFSTNGYMDPAMLFQAPFTTLNSASIFGFFEEDEAANIINIIKKINHNAEVS